MTTLSLKLLIDKNSNKVVFAEAGKEFVDFLFGHLQVPLGSIMGLLSQYDNMVGSGSLSRVYESIQNLDSNFLQPNVNKDSDLLRPKPAFSSNTHTPQLLLNFVPPSHVAKSASSSNTPTPQFLVNPVAITPSFAYAQTAPTVKKETGYVRGAATYIVMDDLIVKPISAISIVTLLNDLNIKDTSFLQEKMVEVDIKKGLELVRASFDSTTVLTDVFIGNKRGHSFLDIWDSFDGFLTSNIACEIPALGNFRIDWKKTPKAHVFKADLPGLKKEEVKIEVEEGRILQISGERSKEQEEKNDKWYHMERSSGKFLRRFWLPENAKIDQFKASMENGVLTVTIPIEGDGKKLDAKATEISVEENEKKPDVMTHMFGSSEGIEIGAIVKLVPL